MHYIQKDIITKLAHSSPLRFSQLQPRGIPNNTFSYHLKQLRETGYVIPTPNGYTATRKALKTLPYDLSANIRHQRPVTITMLYITTPQHEVLLLRRAERPFTDWFGIPSGMIHGSETIGEAAQRELYEKTGIIDTAHKLYQHGVLDFRYRQQQSHDIFVHAIGFVYSYTYLGDTSTLICQGSDYGELSWSHLGRANILPEVHEVTTMIAAPTPSVVSIDFDEPTL